MSDINASYEQAVKFVELLSTLELKDRIPWINELRLKLHEVSPFSREPVDCVQWVHADDVEANDYNPNKVAPPEMKLLEHSIKEDGYTQPIVAWHVDGKYVVVDGFHRHRVGKESQKVRERVHEYLPLSIINADRQDRSDRIASTIRHNRARGKHQVQAMSDIVVELKRRNWSDDRICRELGMDQDEVLRLCQITGLSELFSDRGFSAAWDVEGEAEVSDFSDLSDDTDTYGNEVCEFRTVNTGDDNRIFHTYDKWECYKAGFYATTYPGKTRDECEEEYRLFLSDDIRFRNALDRVIVEWKHSCEHYLTNSSMNRIAWLGQAAMCYDTGIPSAFRSGFSLLSTEEQDQANQIALEYLNKWLVANGRSEVGMEEAYSGRQVNIY